MILTMRFSKFLYFFSGKRIFLDSLANGNVYWFESGSYRLDTMLQTINNLPDRSNLNIFCKEKGFAIYVLAVHLMEAVRKAFLKRGYFLVIIGRGITGKGCKAVCNSISQGSI